MKSKSFIDTIIGLIIALLFLLLIATATSCRSYFNQGNVVKVDKNAKPITR